MDIREITNELDARGYIASPTTVTKNGVSLKAISLRRTPDQKICPVVYVDDLLEAPIYTPSEVADIIKKQLEGKESINIGDPSRFLDEAFILKNAYIAMQKASSQNLIKRISDLDDAIEEYIYLKNPEKTGEYWTIKLTPEICDTSDVDINELWACAQKNTYSHDEIKITSMREMLIQMTGVDYMPDFGGTSHIYVITNQDQLYGANQINNPLIKKWAMDNNFHKLIVLLCSLHEVLVIPADEEEISLDQLEIIIGQVNATAVSPEEQLGDKPIIVNL